MKNVFLTICTLFALSAYAWAGNWSFGGGWIYYDNTVTQWEDSHFMLVIGDEGWSAVYDMEPDAVAGRYKCMLPLRGWGNATYMAVMADCYTWDTGAWDKNNLKNAIHYTAPYTAGLTSSVGQGFLLTPQSAENGAPLVLSYLGTGHAGRRFTTQEKNNCQRLEGDTAITLIYSTSSSRFNTSFTDIKKIYVYGPTTTWSEKGEYRLNRFSEDSCFYRTFSLSEIERPGNSGQPEFKFMVYLTNGSKEEVRAHSSWERGIDNRLVFINRCDNMMMLLPGDDIAEVGARKNQAIEIRPLAEWGTISGDSVKEARISNFRRVPGTKNLYRSYHPYNPDTDYDTEEMRFHYVRKNALKVGIMSDICLNGDQSGRAGTTYMCGSEKKTVTIPDYYQRIMDAGHVLLVGTENGHTPDYTTCLYQTDKQRYGEWMREIVRYIIDEQNPMPFQIHCALGGDRTGAISATIAALCGAGWEEIAHNYEQTSELLIQQYRHRKLLRYCLKQMLGKYPDEMEDLQTAMRDYMINNGYLTGAEIDAMVARLNEEIEVTYRVEVPAGTPSVYMSATWNNWGWTQMDKVDDTHYIYTRVGASPACEYKYSAGPSWDYEDMSTKGTANRLWQENDVVPAWKAIPTPTSMEITAADRGAWKELRDGEIRIHRQGEVYTITGNKLK